MQNQKVNENLSECSEPSAEATAHQPSVTNPTTRYELRKPHKPIIDIEESKEEPMSKQKNATSSISPQNDGAKRPTRGAPGMKTSVQKSRPEMERASQRQNGKPRNGNKSDRIHVSTREVPKKSEPAKTYNTRNNWSSRKFEDKKCNPRVGAHAPNSPQTSPMKHYPSKNPKISPQYEAPQTLELKETESQNRRKNNLLEENLLFTKDSETPELAKNLNEASTETALNISQTQSNNETIEMAPCRAELLRISKDGNDNIVVHNNEDIPEIPSTINEQSTEDNVVVQFSEVAAEDVATEYVDAPNDVIAIETVIATEPVVVTEHVGATEAVIAEDAVVAPETKHATNIIHKSSESSSSLNSWQHDRRSLDLPMKNRTIEPFPKPQFKNFSKTARGKSNAPKSQSHAKSYTFPPISIDDKNENKDWLSNLNQIEEAVRQKFERQEKERTYELMFLPVAFSDGSIDESALSGLYGRFNVDEITCHYRETGERFGSGTFRVWDQYAERVKNHAADRKWRALRMFPLEKQVTNENLDNVVNTYVQFANDWPAEMIEKTLRGACPESDIQMIYNYNNQPLNAAFVAMKYSEIEKLNLVLNVCNGMMNPLQVRIFEVPESSDTSPAK